MVSSVLGLASSWPFGVEDLEAITRGLEAEGDLGGIGLEAREGARSWTLRLRWEPETEALMPTGAHALLRWRKLRDRFQDVLGVGLGIGTDEAQRSVSLSMMCDPRWVFVALAQMRAVSGWLGEAQRVLGDAAGGVLDDALDGWLAGVDREGGEEIPRAAPGREDLGFIPTLGEVRWVDEARDGAWRVGALGGRAWIVALGEGAASRGALSEMVVLGHGLQRRFGLSLTTLEVAQWARHLAQVTGAMRHEGQPLAMIKHEGEAVELGEVLRLLGSLWPRFERDGLGLVGVNPRARGRLSAGVKGTKAEEVGADD